MTPTQRRILAVALALVAVLAIVQLVVLPAWRAYFDNREAIAQHREDIVRFARLATRSPELEAALRDLEESDELARYVLDQESAALAAAALQERVKTVVQRSGGALTSTQVLPAEEERGFRRVTVNVRMAVSTPALQKVFYELESALPYLVVDDVVILSRASRRRRRAIVPGSDMLDVRFNLAGFMRGAEEGA